MRAKFNNPLDIVKKIRESKCLPEIDLASSAIMDAVPVLQTALFECAKENALFLVKKRLHPYFPFIGFQTVFLFELIIFEQNTNWKNYLEIKSSYTERFYHHDQQKKPIACNISADIKEDALPWVRHAPMLRFNLLSEEYHNSL